MRPYRFLDEAQAEFFDAIAYYDDRSLKAADAFIDAVENAIRHIRTDPDIGSPLTRNLYDP